MEELEGLDDDFMKEYRNRRMEEMKKIFRVDISRRPWFSELTG